MGKNITGFPNFTRHLAAIHRLPPMHSPVRSSHVSDVVYSMLRRGISKNLVKGLMRSVIRRGASSPASDRIESQREGAGPWKDVLKKNY